VDERAFEWNALFILDNYSNYGENCGYYIKATKYGAGPTFGGCIEAVSAVDNDPTGLISLELDNCVTGKDNGYRLILDLVACDANVTRGKPPSADAEVSTAIRIGASQRDPHVRITTGIKMNNGVLTGIDCTNMSGTTALKLGAGQVIQIGDTVVGEEFFKTVVAPPTPAQPETNKANPIAIVAVVAAVVAALAVIF
jgi:hypothetical protein